MKNQIGESKKLGTTSIDLSDEIMVCLSEGINNFKPASIYVKSFRQSNIHKDC